MGAGGESLVSPSACGLFLLFVPSCLSLSPCVSKALPQQKDLPQFAFSPISFSPVSLDVRLARRDSQLIVPLPTDVFQYPTNISSWPSFSHGLQTRRLGKGDTETNNAFLPSSRLRVDDGGCARKGGPLAKTSWPTESTVFRRDDETTRRDLHISLKRK